MSTTTIRLPEDLRVRLKEAAERAGTTAHSFILDAIAEKTEHAERRSDFESLANSRYAKIIASGKTIPWNEMRQYLDDRVQGKKAARPSARKLAR